MIRRFKFTETAADGVAQATMRIPANTVVRTHWNHIADWTAGGTAVLRVTVGDEVLHNNVNLKAAGPFTPNSNGFDASAAADKVGTLDAAKTLTVTVTKGGTATGTAGRGELLVETTSVTELNVPQVDTLT